MTDKEKLIALFTEFEIEFTVDKAPSHCLKQDFTNCIVCLAPSKKVDGYLHFMTTFDFDDKDKFIKMGIWE